MQQLDQIVTEAMPSVPLTTQVRADEERVDELLDKMRVVIGPGNSGPPTN